jgi:cytochrome c biogenesis protein CcdA
MVGMASYIIGVILMIACISLFADKTKQEIGSHNVGGIVSDKDKVNYGYSFYLAIVSLLLAVGAGVCRGIEHKKLA